MSSAADLLRVLVVDDIAASRQALCDLVSGLGHCALSADSGEAALRQVEQETPDLVLLDLLMPGLDGFEVTQRLRRLAPQRWIPIIVTSGLQGEQPFIKALEAGADDYLARPVEPALLAAKLRHYARVLRLQAQTQRLVQRQRDILDNILDPVVTLDEGGRITDFNQAAIALRDAQGRAISVGAACEPFVGVGLPALLEQRQLQLRREGGDSYSAALGLSEWQDGGQRHYTLVMRDLTEQQRIERMKDEFLATVSHELRTPLTSVLGALSLLAAGTVAELPAAARPLAEMARRNGQRLSRLIDDMLDLTKLEGGQLMLQQRVQPMAPLLQEAVAANRAYAVSAGIELTALGLETPGLPEVRLDAERLQQVLSNLLSNAIKHSPAGGRVELILEGSAQAILIKVRDYGPGIPPVFRARMFEKFSQADGTDRRAQEGTGLGLYITRQFVERMGGRIWSEDPEGGGALFCVSFPAAAGQPQPPLLLHVDRSWEARDRIARWLGPAWRVEGVADLKQAEALLERAQVCIADPQGQGSADTFCQSLKRVLKGRPLLLLSDSLDADFCRAMDLHWLRASECSSHQLLETLRHLSPGAKL
jgi:signal transduction histidine kinase